MPARATGGNECGRSPVGGKECVRYPAGEAGAVAIGGSGRGENVGGGCAASAWPGVVRRARGRRWRGELGEEGGMGCVAGRRSGWDLERSEDLVQEGMNG
jgi:hypothetical protein